MMLYCDLLNKIMTKYDMIFTFNREKYSHSLIGQLMIIPDVVRQPAAFWLNDEEFGINDCLFIN